MWRWFAGLAAVAVLTVGTAGFVLYRLAIAPSLRLSDANWLAKASPAEHREVAHRALRWGRGVHHDAVLLLGECGGRESVPLLIESLRRFPPAEGLPCTKGHIVQSLESLTGASPGCEHADWARWWENVGRTLPDENFHPRRLPLATAASQASTRAAR